MKVTLTIECENVGELIQALSKPTMDQLKMYADMAAASAAKSDTAARNAIMAFEDIKKATTKVPQP